MVGSKNTYASIRAALERHEWPDEMKYSVYLQGSYANATNTRGNSDVDVVVEATSVNYSNLSVDEKEALGIGKGSYGFQAFRAEVVAALIEYYGSDIVDLGGDKSVTVKAGGNRLNADVVPCVRYKRYKDLEVNATGITFWTQNGNTQVINYPKHHLKNGAAKNAAAGTNGWYKPSVRMFKNARESIVGSNSGLRRRFPSYFVECLIYNSANAAFGPSYRQTFVSVIEDLAERFHDDAHKKFVCQNRRQWLFGSKSVQWNDADAADLLVRLARLWEEW